MSNVVSQNASVFSLLQQGLSNYIVTPANAFGLGGFVFDVEGETTSNLMAEITDHWLEDNSYVQDHIAIKPQEIVLKNYVGELVYQVDTSTNTPVQQVVQKLTILSSYLPNLAKQAQQVQSSLSLNSISNASIGTLTSALTLPNLNNIVDLWALTKNLNPGASKQQQAYLYLKALYQQKILVSLQTPFEFVTNLAIKSIVAIQDETTKTMCDFTITLKKIQTVSTTITSFNPQSFQGRSGPQSQPTVQQGNNQGSDSLLLPLVTGANNMFKTWTGGN